MVMDYLERLPDEILLQIIENLTLHDFLSFTFTCTRIYKVQDDSTWRIRCSQDFNAWDDKHAISSLLVAPLGDVQWKALYAERYSVNRKVQQNLDLILLEQAGRLDRVCNIAAFGSDAKDVLQTNIVSPPTTPDVLARQWYARAVFNHIQRAKAVETWSNMSGSSEVPLLQALLCFDQFIIGEQALCYEEAVAILNDIAASVLQQNAEWTTFTTRTKALTIAAHLIDGDLVGLHNSRRYLDVRNSLLTLALTEKEHCSLPLISTMIYCHVAQRLGLNARACGFPMHVYAVVTAEEGQDLEGSLLTPQSTPQGSPPPVTLSSHVATLLIFKTDRKMFLDPYQSALEQSYSNLAASLPRMGILARDARLYLQPAEDVDIVIRCGRNIINAVQEGNIERTEQGGSAIEYETALYASMWSLLLLSDHRDTEDHQVISRRRNFLPHLINLFESHHPFDARLVQEYICPLFDITPQQSLLRTHIQDIFRQDLIPRELRDRKALSEIAINYYVGQVFCHKRYQYEGVICGWDPTCMMPEDWMQRMRVSDLERGKQQPFYHILADDLSTRYVAEDNISPLQPKEPPISILRRAGQFFKRWDIQSRAFVSNLKDQYPRD